MLEHIPLAISSLKAAREITTSLLQLRDFDKISSATMELKSCLVQTYDHIISEKERVLLLKTKISDLEKECNRLKDWSAEKQQYSWRQIADGVSVYIENNVENNFQNTRKLCCNCFDKTIKSTLQQSNELKPGMGRITTLTCPNGCPTLEFKQYVP